MEDQAIERQTMRRNIRELPRAAWFLILGSFVNRFATFAVLFLVLYLTRQGFSVAQAGAAVAAYGLGEVAAAAVGGYLADRIGRRATIIISTFSTAVAMVVLSQVQVYPSILPLTFLAGLAEELYRPASAALLSDLVPEGRRVTAFAVVRFAVNLGFAGGAAAAGFLATRSFLWVFLADAASSAAFGLIALVALPEGRRATPEERRGGAGYGVVLRDRALVLFLVASVLGAFVYFQQQAALPLHVRAAGLRSSDFGLLLSLNGLLVVLFELPLSSVTMRLPAKQMLAVGYLLVGLGFALTAWADSLALLMGTVAIWTVGEMIGAPVGYAYVADLAPEYMRGRYQGAYGLTWGTGTVTGPAVGTVLFAWSATGLWVVCGLMGVVAAALVLGIRPARVHPEPKFVEAGPGIPAPEATRFAGPN